MGIGDRDVKWDTHDQVVTKIMAAENYIRITVVTPIKSWVNNRSSESVSSSFRESSSIPSSSNVIKVFPPSRSRTSFSSLSSNASDNSYNYGSEAVATLRNKRSWAVFKIKDQM